MFSISASSKSELEVLKHALSDFAKRPNLYGFPYEVEELAKHTTHVCLSIIHGMWEFSDTELFWRHAAYDLGLGERFTMDNDAQRIIQWWRWGIHIEAARHQVLSAFKNIWCEFQHHDRYLEHTAQWVETLLLRPDLVDSPDVLETVLWGLMRLVFEPHSERFGARLDQERKSVGGGSVRGLADVGSHDEWQARAPKDITPDFTSEPRVSAGIQEILKRLLVMEHR